MPNEIPEFQQLVERCQQLGIPCQQNESGIWISMRSGSTLRPVFISHPSHAKYLLDAHFEKYTLPSNYRAIWCQTESYIEVAVKPAQLGFLSSSYIIEKRLLKGDAKGERPRISISGKQGETDIVIEFSPISDDLCSLAYGIENPREQYSLKFRGVSATSHDVAVDVIEKIGNAFLFKIDLEHDVSLTLVSERVSTFTPYSPTTNASFTFPVHCYDQTPMALYWYAQSAESAPLLQFLGFYQCLEFYFFRSHDGLIGKRVRTAIDEGHFRNASDVEIGRYINGTGRTRRERVDERSMLRITLQASVDREQLLEFISSWESRKKTLTNKLDGVTEIKVPVHDSQADLRAEAANRVYDIRCKIVHVKEDSVDHTTVILPYSNEEFSLKHDIDLVRFLARRVIIASGTPPTWP